MVILKLQVTIVSISSEFESIWGRIYPSY